MLLTGGDLGRRGGIKGHDMPIRIAHQQIAPLLFEGLCSRDEFDCRTRHLHTGCVFHPILGKCRNRHKGQENRHGQHKRKDALPGLRFICSHA